MNFSSLFKTMVLCLFMVSGLYGCRVGASVGFPLPEKVIVDEPGPPPHAKAYGRRAQHRYYYYPDASVYFDLDRKSYFYLEGTSWRAAVELPREIRVRLGSSVTMELDTDKPYSHYGDHKKKYPPGQLKKKKNKGKGRWKEDD